MTMLWPKDPKDPMLIHHTPDSIADLQAMQAFCMREVPDGFDEWSEYDRRSWLGWDDCVEDCERQLGWASDREERQAAAAMGSFAQNEKELIEFKNRRIAHATTHP